jgi:EAL domain-containing protein (putative c-di-GMP-specific phosphodiesterase class I)
VLRTACQQLRLWHDAGYTELSVAVNISARQFQQDDIPKLIQQILNETGARPTFLHLELTESVILQNSDVAIESLRKLKALGIVIALDDFGTGYSSLSYLKRFPIDIIKIDQSFTADLSSSTDASSIILAIIAMARSLHIKTVAEGVENQAQLDFLKGHGCDVVQGYYFSRAISASSMTDALRQNSSGMLLGA